ncbi:hypothetical protein ASF49_07050 [Methylobacterium sp. Leaf104]|uniref:hypothetical protein n=1 Tax=Methylobacterium TaxID=407 RepID=UPI0006F95BE1|nr:MULTISPECIES: hypothetical protein [Methylobacterium]KQP33637.1 hypothetical protein ASF49_07050 [Methylobacterium sp. Leaf104]MCI9879822.1 hypothetical protein [Methylobacterium goesingense]
MSASAEKSDPKLWEKVKKQVTESDKGGKPGQWSARKAQAATKAYKDAGGGYQGKKSSDNHLKQWTEEEWDTKSGKKSGETGERYLPKKARESVSKSEYDRSTKKKRVDSAKGRQFSKQPADVAKKTAAARRSASGKSGSAKTKADLMKAARDKNIPGRSKMSKGELEHALHA